MALELAQKYIGEGGRLVRELFSLAKDKSPAIIFPADEIDAIGAKRLDGSTSGDREVQRTLMQLLAELDGFDELEHVKIIAATNRPDILDDALLRPGRFDRIIEIPIPEEDSRKALSQLHLSSTNTKKRPTPGCLQNQRPDSAVLNSKQLCVEAGMIAIRSDRDTVLHKDVVQAIGEIEQEKNVAIWFHFIT